MKDLKGYAEAFKDQRKEYYEAMKNFAEVGFLAMLAVWVYVTILIVEKVIGWF